MMKSQFSTEGAPSIPREQAKKVFMEVEQRKMEKMKQMMSNPGMQQDPEQGMMAVMIETCKLND